MWLKVFNLESKFSPADSGGLHQTPFSGLWSNFNYKISPADSSGHTRPPYMWLKVFNLESKFSPADSTRPPSLDYGQILIIKQFSPVDSGGHTRPPSLDLFSFFIPADSGGLRRNPHVTICDISGVRSIPPESGKSGGIRRNMWGSVKYGISSSWWIAQLSR